MLLLDAGGRLEKEKGGRLKEERGWKEENEIGMVVEVSSMVGNSSWFNRKSWTRISSKVKRISGSVTSLFLIKSFAFWLMEVPSGKEYWFSLMRLYLALTSLVSKGGLPTKSTWNSVSRFLLLRSSLRVWFGQSSRRR